MKRVRIDVNGENFPAEIRKYFLDAYVYDSSSSEEAKVFFVDKGEGYYLKCAPKGTLKIEADMTQFFYEKGLGACVLDYLSSDKDYFLTKRVPGEDCTYEKYLAEPKRLCDVMGETLRQLHETDFATCPVQNRLESYFDTAYKNYSKGIFDNSLFGEEITITQAWKKAEEGKKHMKAEVLIHGDYCLPNIMLDKFKLSGFVDVGNGGVGDRHIDIFWGAWSLWYNLKTDKYTQRFFDSYGKDVIDYDILSIVRAAECFG